MKRNRRRTSSAVNSSSSQKTSYLFDECWESIFRFIIDDNDRCYLSQICNNHRHLNSLSLVCKQFLSITNRLRFSLTVFDESTCCRLFKRFTNLSSLNLTGCNDLNKLLRQISHFPLKQLTSLNISYTSTLPANGLRAFSHKITTLTSFICSNIYCLTVSDMFLIAECFPFLQELDLSSPSKNCININFVDGIKALSLTLIKLRKINLSGFPINKQLLFHLFNNCKHLEELIMFKCARITNEELASALRERPPLKSLSFSISNLNLEFSEVFATSHFIDSLVSLKGLTCLVLQDLNISDELLYSIAREGLPLTSLDLGRCTGHSYDGIICLLSKCQRMQHLDLQNTYFLIDQHVVQLSSSFLVDLVSINLSRCRELTYLALFALVRNCPLLSEIKMERIGNAIVGNSDNLVDFAVYPQLKALFMGNNSWLSDESIIMFSSIFPNLQLLDLKSCNSICESVCVVLRKCCKIRHLNLAYCSRVKLLGMNSVVPNLEVLNLSYTNVDDETLYLISKSCSGLFQLLLRSCYGITAKGVNHVVKNCTQLRKIMVSEIHLSDKNRELFSRHVCLIY